MEKIKSSFNKYKPAFIATVAIMVIAAAVSIGYVFAVSPESIRNPKLEHAHLRMSLIVDGQEVNFGEDTFQQEYNKDTCSAELPKTPIHFHDSKNQFVHLHWKGMTGGMVLKYYGWNKIGGQDDSLGYRLDELPSVKAVKIFGNVLPTYPKDAKLWVYSGDDNSYKERSADDFLKQDFETFFGVKSTVNVEEVSLLDTLFPKAYAHGSNHESEANTDGEERAEMLKRIQNLLGSVVVFAQKEKPSDDQVKARFEKLEPLSDSVCGG